MTTMMKAVKMKFQMFMLLKNFFKRLFLSRKIFLLQTVIVVYQLQFIGYGCLQRWGRRSLISQRESNGVFSKNFSIINESLFRGRLNNSDLNIFSEKKPSSLYLLRSTLSYNQQCFSEYFVCIKCHSLYYCENCIQLLAGLLGFQIILQSIYIKNVIRFFSKILNIILKNKFLCS